MSLAKFITTSTARIVADWAEFARGNVPGASVEERRDHIGGMLKAIARDLGKPQTAREQTAKSKGAGDTKVEANTAANAHGTDRAATGYTPVQMVSEFRALRASVLRLWSKAKTEFSRTNLQEVTRFNEAIDQLLAESLATYSAGVDRSKDMFVGVLGHDLRNPLGAIMMGAALMLKKEGANWPHARTASAILNSGSRMDRMISDLMDFTRTRLGDGIPIVREDTDLKTVCRQTVDEIVSFHPACAVHFEARGRLRGRWDRGRIGQALSNLVGNAYQHGRATVPIDVSVRGERADVVITVHNQGPAIPRGQLQDVFDPFRQLQSPHAQKKDMRSLGLGLYIVRGIVVAHGGTVEVASNKRGTTFTIRLPRKAPALPT